jgi:hypothetical protein
MVRCALCSNGVSWLNLVSLMYAITWMFAQDNIVIYNIYNLHYLAYYLHRWGCPCGLHCIMYLSSAG